MHRLTVGAVTYVFGSLPDFELARSISMRIDNTRTRFQAELTKRWIRFTTEERGQTNGRD
jgi:hypothetical protein